MLLAVGGVVLGGCFLLGAEALGADASPGWTPEFSMQVKTIGTVVPSPDAQWVAYTQIKPVTEDERSEQVSQIFLARADGSRRFQLTRNEKGSRAPAFSPDGKALYFLSDRSGKTNIYRVLIEGDHLPSESEDPVYLRAALPDAWSYQSCQ